MGGRGSDWFPPPRREGLGGAGRPRGTWGENFLEAPAAERVQALALRALLRKVVSGSFLPPAAWPRPGPETLGLESQPAPASAARSPGLPFPSPRSSWILPDPSRYPRSIRRRAAERGRRACVSPTRAAGCRPPRLPGRAS